MSRSVRFNELPATISRYDQELSPSALTIFIWAIPVVFYLSFAIIAPLREPYAYDLAINYSAATLLRTGSASIYDRNALRNVHEERIGSTIPDRGLYQGLFTTYINPPITALLLLPFSFLSFFWARIAFLLFNNVLYLCSVFLLTRMLNASYKTITGVAVWFYALTFYPFVIASNWLGQIDGVILFLLTLSLFFTLRNRDGWAGVCLTLGCAIKISPIILLGFFLARRRWSVWLGVVVTALLVLIAILATVGLGTATQFLSSYLPLIGRGSGFFENQSLLGAIYHYIASPEALRSLDAMSDNTVARVVWAGLAIALLVTVYTFVRRAPLEHTTLTAVAFGTFVLISVLGGSISWDHYMTWLLIPAVALMVDWLHDPWVEAKAFWTLFVLGIGAIDFPYPFQVWLYRWLGRFIISCGTYGMLILLYISIVRLIRARASAAGLRPSLKAQ
jgi:hypothetical protein